MSARYKLAFGLAAILWPVLAWVHLYWFSLPGMDTWCYFAPSVAADRPLRLVQPMLGSFGGADHAWGLHWPGVLLMNSILFAGRIDFGAAAVAWSILLWLAAAGSLSWLAWKVSHSAGLALFVFLLLLADRSGFIITSYQRMEPMAVLASSILATSLIARIRREPAGTLSWVAHGAAVFFCPLAHPLAGAFAGGVLLVSFWLARRDRGWRLVFLDAVCLAGGVAALAGWFLLQADVLDQFRDHARSAAAIGFGRGPFLIALVMYYAPLYTGLLLYVPGLVGAAWMLRDRRLPASASAPERTLLGVFTFLSCLLFLVLHLQTNPCYVVLLLPATIPVMAELVRRWIDHRPAWLRPAVVATASAVFLSLHGAFWATRTLKFWEAGRPRFRAELDAFWKSLPPDAQVLVPEVLWEQAVSDRTRQPQALANTLPYFTSVARRERYEHQCYTDLAPNTVLVVDAFQGRKILAGIDPAQWRLERKVSHVLTGRSGSWGYDFDVYRRVGAASVESQR